MWRALILGVVTLMVGCGRGPIRLTVDVRTDYHPGLDFTEVVTSLSRTGEVGGEVREETFILDGSEDFIASERVAQLDDALVGAVVLNVRLVDAAGLTVAERNIELVLEESYAALVLLTSNCAGVACPAPAGSPELSECLDARCVDPACSDQAPELCPEPCAVDADCAPETGCVARQCIDGTCFCADPPSIRDAGVDAPVDTGPPCECAPGATEDMTEVCGGCGTGMRTSTRTCGMDCQWGDFVPGACMGGGCTPGTTRACANGDPCGERVCRADCTFGPCRLIPGARCFRIAPGSTIEGSNFRCCGTYMWEYCLAGCNWSGACSSCDPVIGCPGCG